MAAVVLEVALALSRAHLLRTGSRRVELPPVSLDAFPVHPARPDVVVEGVRGVPLLLVRTEMEFRNHICD